VTGLPALFRSLITRQPAVDLSLLSMHNIRFGLTILFFVLGYVYRPGEYKSDPDSTMLWAKQAENVNRAAMSLAAVKMPVFFEVNRWLAAHSGTQYLYPIQSK